MVGRRFGGGARLPFNPKKSVVGSLAMFLSTIALSLGCVLAGMMLEFLRTSSCLFIPVVSKFPLARPVLTG